jgi:hypothetical protein
LRLSFPGGTVVDGVVDGGGDVERARVVVVDDVVDAGADVELLGVLVADDVVDAGADVELLGVLVVDGVVGGGVVSPASAGGADGVVGSSLVVVASAGSSPAGWLAVSAEVPVVGVEAVVAMPVVVVVESVPLAMGISTSSALSAPDRNA